MLQDTDFFKLFPEWITIGDVYPKTYEWAVLPAPVEAYTITAEWRFRSERVGNMRATIQPSLIEPGGDSELVMDWVGMFFEEKWQQQGLYSIILSAMMDRVPEYGITKLRCGPLTRESESVFMASGWEWTDQGFVVDLTGKRIKQWRKYKDGGRHPAWRRDVLDERGLSDDVEAV